MLRTWTFGATLIAAANAVHVPSDAGAALVSQESEMVLEESEASEEKEPSSDPLDSSADKLISSFTGSDPKGAVNSVLSEVNDAIKISNGEQPHSAGPDDGKPILIEADVMAQDGVSIEDRDSELSVESQMNDADADLDTVTTVTTTIALAMGTTIAPFYYDGLGNVDVSPTAVVAEEKIMAGMQNIEASNYLRNGGPEQATMMPAAIPGPAWGAMMPPASIPGPEWATMNVPPPSRVPAWETMIPPAAPLDPELAMITPPSAPGTYASVADGKYKMAMSAVRNTKEMAWKQQTAAKQTWDRAEAMVKKATTQMNEATNKMRVQQAIANDNSASAQKLEGKAKQRKELAERAARVKERAYSRSLQAKRNWNLAEAQVREARAKNEHATATRKSATAEINLNEQELAQEAANEQTQRHARTAAKLERRAKITAQNGRVDGYSPNVGLAAPMREAGRLTQQQIQNPSLPIRDQLGSIPSSLSPVPAMPLVR